MKKPIKECLGTEEIHKFEENLEALISEATFTYWVAHGYTNEKDKLEIHHQFDFPVGILDNLENLLLPVKYISREDIHWVCHGILDRMLFDNLVSKKACCNKISDLPYSQDESLMVKDYIDDVFRKSAKQVMSEYFYGLPFEFMVSFPLAAVKLPISESIKISEKVELQKTEEYLDSDLCVKARVSIKVQGASEQPSANPMLEDAMRQFKALVAALYALGVLHEPKGLKKDHYRSILDDDDVLGYYSAHSVSEPPKFLRNKHYLMPLELRPAERDFICSLRLNESLIEPTLLEGKRVKKWGGDSSDVKIENLKQLLAPVRNIFVTDCPDKRKKEVERVRNALEWFFNALTEERQFLPIIQLSMVAEILLGSKAHNHVTDRLSDRCAYLIAKDALERSEIKTRFEKAYDRRSRIIHGGDFMNNDNDKFHYDNLKSFLQKALAKEINMIPTIESPSASELSDRSQRQG